MRGAPWPMAVWWDGRVVLPLAKAAAVSTGSSIRPPPASSSDKMYQKLKVISATSRSGCAEPRSTALTTGSACCGSRRMRWRYCSPG